MPHRLDLGRPGACTSAIAAATLALLSGCGGSDDAESLPSLPPVTQEIALAPVTDCTMAGIGATALTADAPVTILDVSTGTTGTGSSDKPYCLIKVKVDPQVNIWVAMPTEKNWNGRLRAEGGGAYQGIVGIAADSVRQGFIGMQTDTGHTGTGFLPFLDGSFGMSSPGVANTQLQTDFAHRSEHLMAVVGKQLAKAFYGQAPVRTYWYGCSTGGRQGLMMAQRYPEDYDAILAGAPAIHWDRFQAYQIWPQVVMSRDLGAPIASAKLALATQKAVASCDAADGVTDGVVDDPRNCKYDPSKDSSITRASCTSADNTCLTPTEANAIRKIWEGARNLNDDLLWPGVERGAPLQFLAGATPFPMSTLQPKYWVYLDPAWDWTTLNYENYETFFNKTVEMVGPLMATENPDLSAFRARGGRLIMYHGWADPLIMPQGTSRYYDAVVNKLGGGYAGVGQFAKLFMAPGMLHCSGGDGPNDFGQGTSGRVPAMPDRDVFRALMAWSERGQEPQKVIATKFVSDDPAQGVLRTRPLCPYPTVARYSGSGSTDDAANFTCVAP
jgi:pimeloyl-ACP methyl ester carboxylesterase